MGDFLKTWYGITIFLLFDLIALTLVICITYRWLSKYILDWLASLVCIVILSPLYAVIFIRAAIEKANGRLKSIFAYQSAVGQKGKNIRLSTFETKDENGQMHAYGEWLTRTKLYTLSKFFDLFLGKVSIVGVKPFTEGDCVFLSNEEEERHTVRPGFINPLVLRDKQIADYDQMIANDLQYASKFSFFGDCKIFLKWMVKCIRGEDNGYLGNTRDVSYAQALLDEQRITQADYDEAMRTE